MINNVDKEKAELLKTLKYYEDSNDLLNKEIKE